MTTTFDRSIAVVLSALDEARGAAADPCPARPTGDDELAELLVTTRLEMSVIGLARALERSRDVGEIATTLDAVAAATTDWLGDPVIQRQLARMRPRDRSAAVTCRVEGAASEVRRVAAQLRDIGSGDVESARHTARRTGRACRAALEDAVLSVRHAA